MELNANSVSRIGAVISTQNSPGLRSHGRLPKGGDSLALPRFYTATFVKKSFRAEKKSRTTSASM